MIRDPSGTTGRLIRHNPHSKTIADSPTYVAVIYNKPKIKSSRSGSVISKENKEKELPSRSSSSSSSSPSSTLHPRSWSNTDNNSVSPSPPPSVASTWPHLRNIACGWTPWPLWCPNPPRSPLNTHLSTNHKPSNRSPNFFWGMGGIPQEDGT